MQAEFSNSRINSKVFSKEAISLDPTQRAWIEVSGKAIVNNVKQICSLLRDNCKFMAVVKADGYGHDAKFVSENAIKGGAEYLGVATLQEGICLRSEGITAPILILGNVYTKKDLFICFQNKLMPTISCMKEFILCDLIGKKYNSKFILHLKVDTGMSRLGFGINDFVNNFDKFIGFENVLIDGIYSHLSSADEDNALDKKSFTQLQKRKFKTLLEQINIAKYPRINVHLANSAGTLLGKDFHFDMVRVGLSMYGYSALINSNNNLELRPALFLKSKISFIRTIENDTSVSYGRKFITNRRTKLAVVSIGYADGICRKLSNQIGIIYKGNIYPQVGSITMDQLMVDVTKAKDIKVGETILLLGKNGERSISPVDWANKASTIPWEILCSFKNRLPRIQIP